MVDNLIFTSMTKNYLTKHLRAIISNNQEYIGSIFLERILKNITSIVLGHKEYFVGRILGAMGVWQLLRQLLAASLPFLPTPSVNLNFQYFNRLVSHTHLGCEGKGKISSKHDVQFYSMRKISYIYLICYSSLEFNENCICQ